MEIHHTVGRLSKSPCVNMLAIQQQLQKAPSDERYTILNHCNLRLCQLSTVSDFDTPCYMYTRKKATHDRTSEQACRDQVDTNQHLYPMQLTHHCMHAVWTATQFLPAAPGTATQHILDNTGCMRANHRSVYTCIDLALMAETAKSTCSILCCNCAGLAA